jgi:large subunit ribosomal protein L7/L12
VAKVEKTKFDINVVSLDTSKKLNIIKEIKNMLNLGLKESKDLVEKGAF